jgi:P4 family phage/plasmid primase-like protien
VEKLLCLVNKSRFETEYKLKFLAGLLKSGDYKKEFVDYTKREDLWNNTKENGYTINTLKYMAIKDNLSDYVIAFDVLKKNKNYDEIDMIYNIIDLIKYEIYPGESEISDFFIFNGKKWIRGSGYDIINKIKEKIDDLNIKIENFDQISYHNIKFIRGLLFNKNDKVLFDDVRDNRKELLLFENGVYDLENLFFRESLPEDYITLSCDYDYNEKIKEERFLELDKYLNSLFTQEYKLYFYKQLANALLGKSNYLNIWNGSGCNGKTVLMNIVRRLFGKYAEVIDSKILTSEISRIRKIDVIEKNKGIKLIICDELELDYELDSSFLKELLSGELIIKSERSYEKKLKHAFGCNIILVCNKLPTVDNSVWRRIRLLKFEKKINMKCIKNVEEFYNLKQALMMKILEYIRDGKEFEKKTGEICKTLPYLENKEIKEEKIEDKSIENCINCQDESGKTALIYAIINEKETLVEILIDKKANVNIRDNQGYNAIYYAIESGNKKIIELVLKGNPDKKDNMFGYKSILMLLDELEKDSIVKICDYYL